MPLRMPQGRFRFGRFELDGESLNLTRDGTTIHLQAQPKQVLAHLVRNADRIVSREELQKTIWGGQTFVDFERGLNFCVSQIRAVLGDDAASPTYIRTFARQGYRFIAPVEWISPADPPPLAVSTPRRRTLLIAAMAVLVGAIPVVAYFLRASRPSKPVPVVAVVHFDNETGDPGITRLSDGLTDTFVERLTSASNGRYAVIGNASVLRGPRDQRDLATIASSLRANYVILGQVQAYGGQTRVLAHLIHMPDQTHVWVTRIDRSLTNPLDLEAEAAQKIADEFSRPLALGDVSPFRAKR
jgi:DNA-binding winged helix-turn-helix (wHTH) protein/TolB-like protein